MIGRRHLKMTNRQMPRPKTAMTKQVKGGKNYIENVLLEGRQAQLKVVVRSSKIKSRKFHVQ